jgi:hypothetical protein
MVPPTAQQSLAVTQVTPYSSSPLAAGLETTFQLLPPYCSISGWSAAVVLR